MSIKYYIDEYLIKSHLGWKDYIFVFMCNFLVAGKQFHHMTLFLVGDELDRVW